jgi:hypothetical protein
MPDSRANGPLKFASWLLKLTWNLDSEAWNFSSHSRGIVHIFRVSTCWTTI